MVTVTQPDMLMEDQKLFSFPRLLCQPAESKGLDGMTCLARAIQITNTYSANLLRMQTISEAKSSMHLLAME